MKACYRLVLHAAVEPAAASSSSSSSSAAGASATIAASSNDRGQAAAEADASACAFVDDAERSFCLASCSDMDRAEQPAGFHLKLYDAQRRTLAWMLSSEEQPIE